MNLLDERIAALESIDVAQTKRPDFDGFWDETVSKACETDLDIESQLVEHPFRNVRVQDMSFAGLDGTRIRSWLLLPSEAEQVPVPVIVFYHGYTGSRGTPAGYAAWLQMGVAVVAMDFRMQGGTTGSNTGFTGSSDINPFCMGLESHRSHYFYHVWTDALRAIEVARQNDKIDSDRICVCGGSQGGATSLAMAALHPSASLCIADVPSNCWFEKRIMDRTGSGRAIAEYLRRHPDQVEAVCTTLSYFDNINLVDRITAPTLVSCGLKDPVCPPENVYAAFNKIKAPKRIVPYPCGEHDGGRAVHQEETLKFLAKHFL